MSPRTGARRRLHVSFGLGVLVLGLLGCVLTLFESAAQASTATTGPAPAALPRTGSGAAVAAMFGILCIFAGVLLVAGRRKSRSRS